MRFLGTARWGGRPAAVALAALVSTADSGLADPARREPVDIAQAPWSAIGQINTNAYGRCTGTLIAPDKVATAAHCVFNRATGRFLQPQSVHFVLGYRQGRYVFHTVARAVRRDEAYDGRDPMGSIGRDWAVLTLAEPAPGTIRPIGIATEAPRGDASYVAAGFGRDRLYALTAVRPCPVLDGAPAGMILARCAIVEGYSGGPLLTPDNRIAGIQVAASHDGGRDLLLAVAPARWAGALD